MSSRKIGGGRVLGKAAVPVQHANIATDFSSQFPLRHSSLLPSSSPYPDASVPAVGSSSLDSSAPTSQDSLNKYIQDDSLRSHVSLDQAYPSAVMASSATATASARMICPICSEEMASNTVTIEPRHLDDNHRNLEDVKQDELKDWFEKQVKKARKFQPLAVINQKLKGLDVFESNDALAASQQANSSESASTDGPSSRPIESQRVDPDDAVSHAHWQKPSSNDLCSEPSCGKRLNSTNGKVNCRKCGKLFCEYHAMYQMKLSRSANHEPVRGFWCRVCETCYKSRPGYNDHTGVETDHTSEYQSLRRKTVDKTYLEMSRLEKRLTRLTQMLANNHEHNAAGSGLIWTLSSSKVRRREIEQSVVSWEDDSSALRCPFCQQEFSGYAFRRHHCRTCGRIVCGDLRTECSAEVALSVAASPGVGEKSIGEMVVEVRMCKDCKHTLFGRRDFQEQISYKPPDQRAYENLIQMEQSIRSILPRFQRLLGTLQDTEKPPTPEQLSQASRTRKRLVEAFTQFDTAGRRLRDLPTTSDTQMRLQRQIYQSVTNFLHLHMLPLQALPKILKHAAPHGNSTLVQQEPNGKPQGALASLMINEAEASSQVSSSSLISSLEEEEQTLRGRLIVLEEQKHFVGEMITDANKRRKFDEVSALAQNMQDLTVEIDELQGQIANLDFAAVYTG